MGCVVFMHERRTPSLTAVCSCLSPAEGDGELRRAAPRFSPDLPRSVPRTPRDHPEPESRLDPPPLPRSHTHTPPFFTHRIIDTGFPFREFNTLSTWKESLFFFCTAEWLVDIGMNKSCFSMIIGGKACCLLSPRSPHRWRALLSRRWSGSLPKSQWRLQLIVEERAESVPSFPLLCRDVCSWS